MNIAPTIGRQVWFYPRGIDVLATADDDIAFAATICRIWSDRMVNLQVIDQAGNSHARTSTLLLQGDEDYAPSGSYCQWTPHQLEQIQASPAPEPARQASAINPQNGGWDVFDDALGTNCVVRLSFGAALEFIKGGAKAARAGWSEQGMSLQLQRPDANSKMTLPYLFLSYPANLSGATAARMPWLPSHTDVLADDWYPVR